MMKWTECTSDAEFFAFMEILKDEDLLSKGPGGLTLSAEGFHRMEMLEAAGAATDQAFVAMWFAPETDATYEEGIAPGLADAGFKAFRIDRKEHSNKIDDEIIAEIKRSRFLVADFTCGTHQVDGETIGIARGGVYYEAGFAQGLNMPVIWTVRADQIPLVHFDTRQFNHITWTDPADLREKLSRRVLAVLGSAFPV
jgi:hypothetical protein